MAFLAMVAAPVCPLVEVPMKRSLVMSFCAALVVPAVLVCTRTPAGATEGAMPVISGTWAQEFVTTSISQIPILGEMRAATRTLLRMEIDQTGGEATIRARVCSIEVGGGGGVIRTIVPDALVASLPERNVDVRVRNEGGRVRIDGWEQIEILGATLTNPEADPLPQHVDDPTVTDSDRDGEPGVSVRVRGLVNGEIHLVQRGWSRLDTTTVTNERIDGHIEWNNEQVILGATERVLRNAPPTWPDPSDRRNYFRSVRLDPASTCADVIRSERALFTR